MQSNIAEMLGRNRLPDLDGTNNRIALRRGLLVQGALSTLADSSLRGGIGGEGIGMPCPSCGYFQSLLSVWIVALRNSFCRTLNCAYLQKATPLRQDNLELNLSNKTSPTD